MKKIKTGLIYLFTTVAFLTTVSCSDDDSDNNESQNPQPTGNSRIYNLGPIADPTISGTITFTEFDDNSIRAVIDLQNTPSGGVHPAHIHFNTAIESGGIAISLTPVDGNNGMSTTTFSSLDDGTSISYNQLLNFNGYVNVHLSATELPTIVAQGDIGQNELTGNIQSYSLDTADVPGISGEAEFAERVNGSTLVTITLNGTPAGGSHPAHIHQNDAATGGDIIVGLSPVDGDTGISKTQVTQLVGGAPVSYSDFADIDAYINVHLSDADLATIVAQGNIGSNVGNSNNTTINYDVTNSGASSYIFNGNGLTNSSNPNLTLTKGETYTFTINSPGHPFYINSVQGTGTSNAYNNGVSNNGAVSGTITFTVPSNAPSTLFYNCEFHGSMTGTITIVD